MEDDTYSDMRFTPSGRGGTATSSGRGGSTISRQFTDSEAAVNDRLDSFLQAPAVRIGQGENLGEVYAGIRDDLALRSNFANQLNREQDMAYQQSARQQLAQQADQNDAWTQQAHEALGRIQNGAKAGKDFRELVSGEMANTPGLALNPVFARGAQDFGRFYESGPDHDLRTTADAVKKLELGTAKFNLDAMARFREKNPELADKMIEQASKALESGGFAADNQVLAQQIEHSKRLKEWQDIQGIQNAWNVDGLSGSPDPTLGNTSQQDQLAVIRDSFNQLGLHGIDRPEDIVRNASPGVKSMLANKAFLDRTLQTPEAKNALVDALNTLNDKEAEAPARQKAYGFVLDLTGQHSREMGEIPQREATRKLLDDASKDYNVVTRGVNSGFVNTSKAMHDIVLKNGMEGSDKVAALVSEAAGFMDQIGLGAEDQDAVGRVQKEYGSYLDGIDKNADPAAISQQLRTLMGNFVTKLKEEGALPSKPTLDSIQNGPLLDRGAKVLGPDKVKIAKTPAPGTAKVTGAGTKGMEQKLDAGKATGGAFSSFKAASGFKAPAIDTNRVQKNQAAKDALESQHVKDMMTPAY